MLKAAIWDFDGTLCDTYPAIAGAARQALETFGATETLARITDLANITVDHCIRTLADEHTIPFDQLDAAFDAAYAQITPLDQPPFPGVGALCQQLCQAGVLNLIFTHRRRATLLVLLRTHGLLDYFSDIVAAEDGFPRKPAPDAILYLLERHGIAPQQALMIGDREIDIRAGQAAGVPTCLFGTGIADPAPTRTIRAFGELADLIPQPGQAHS